MPKLRKKKLKQGKRAAIARIPGRPARDSDESPLDPAGALLHE